MKNVFNCRGLSALAILLSFLANTQSGRAASASWNPLPTNNNWLAAPTTNNWSTGPGTSPGTNSGTSSSDIATFNTNSSITSIINNTSFVVGGIVFDTTNASAYTIATSGGTWRVVGSGIHETGTCTNRETITGTLRMASSGVLYVTSDSTTPTATLNIPNGISVNNSGSYGNLILNGTNTGPNVLGGYTEQTPTNILGNLIKTNTGTWLLTAAGTWHSNTFVLGGTLELAANGSITNSTNIIVSAGTLSISNTLSNPNHMWVTNSGALILTNTTPTQTPFTIGYLNCSNATFHLGANGSAPYTDISVTTALNVGPNVTLEFDRIVNLTSQETFTIFSYAGADPNPANFNVTVPSGYSASSLTVGSGQVNVTITPPTSIALIWVGKTNSTLVSNWDIGKTTNWVDTVFGLPQFYQNPDSVQFDDSAATGLVTVITTNTPNAVTFDNSSLSYTINGHGKISGTVGVAVQGGGSVMLADNGDDFSGGITVNSGTVILDNTNGAISGGLLTYGTVQVGNNDNYGALPSGTVDDEGTLVFQRANNLTVSTTLAGGGALTQNGNGTLTLTASNNYTGLTTVSKGTLALSGAGTVSNSYSLVVNNATFDVSAIPGTTLVADFNITQAAINLSATNLLTPIVVNTFEADGVMATSNIINVLTLPAVVNYPATIPLIQSANAITLTGGNFNFVLGSYPAGSTGSLSESSDGTTILLTLLSGPTGQRASVTWAGVDNTTATTNWSDGLNWQLPGAPGVLDNVFFGAGSTTVPSEATVNNFVDTSFTVASLTYNQPASGQWHVTQIPTGNTLTVSGAMTVGGLTADSAKSEVAMVDAGTLVLSNSLTIGNNGNTGPDTGTILDLSGLSNFVFNASSGIITLGTGNRSAGNINLADGSNYITAATINANVASSSSTCSGTMALGAGTNILNIGTFNVAAERSSCTVQFPAGVTTSGLRLRGTAGTDTSRCGMTVGDRTASGSSGTTTGTLSLNGNQVDMKLATLIVGECTAVTPNIGSGVLDFDTGIIDATTVNLAVNTSTGTANSSATIGAGATLIVGTGGMSMVNQTSTGTGSSTFTLNGGTVICSNSIIKSTTTDSTANISITGGTVNMVSGVIGTLAAPIDSLTLNGGTTLQLNVVAGKTNIVATSVSASGTTTINIASFVGLTGTTQVPLFYYGSGDPWSSLALGTVPAGFVVGNGGALIDNMADQTIDILVTPPAPTIWVGAVGSVLNSSWDYNTVNWMDSGTPVAYADMDYAQFDDTASNFVVTLTTTVSPAGLTVNNSLNNYTFNGGGQISGTVSLVKEGSATLVLDNTGTNNFGGGVSLTTGTLQIGNNDTNGNVVGSIADNANLVLYRSGNLTLSNTFSGSGMVTQIGTNVVTLSGTNASFTGKVVVTNGILNTTGTTGLGGATASTVVTNGGTFDDNAIAFNGVASPSLFVSGPGFGGLGAIINSGAAQESAFSNITMSANVTFGGTNRWDIRAGSGTNASLNMYPAGSPYNLTKVGTNEVAFVNVGTIDAGLDNIYVEQGELAFQEGTAQVGNPAGNIIVSPGATLEVYSLAAPLNKVITLNGNGTNDSFKCDNGVSPDNLVTGPITLNGNCVFDISGGDAATIGSVIGGTGGLTKITSGTLTLTNVDTYTGNTTISNGILVLGGSGSLASSNIIIAAGADLNAASRANQTLTLNAGQTLSGFGSVTGLVSAVSGSTIAPGSSASIGTLTFSNNVTLGGTNTMKVSRLSGAANDVLDVVGAGTLTLGGTLNVTSLGGTFVAGDTFKLFTAGGGISGTFSATNLPALSGGLDWVATNLVNGVLSVVNAVNTNPTNIITTVSGNALTLSWPADHIGWRLLAQTNSLAAGLNPSTNAWVAVPGSASVNTENITMDPNQGTVFYRLVYP